MAGAPSPLPAIPKPYTIPLAVNKPLMMSCQLAAMAFCLALWAVPSRGAPASKAPAFESPAQEIAAERDLVEQVYKLFLAEKFDELDKLADELRATKAKFPRGFWKLPLFYQSIARGGKTDYDYVEGIKRLKKWVAAKPESITARVALGSMLVGYGWRARGTDYISETDPEDLKDFQARLAMGRKILEEAEKLPVRCPGLYAPLLSIGQGMGWDREEYDEVFEKAVALEPHYTPFYNAKRAYLLPQWGGRPGEWEEFAEESAERTKAALGMSLYTRIMWNAAASYGRGGKYLFSKTKASWPKMRQGFLDIERMYPGSWINLNMFAWFACVAGDKATARGLFERIGDNFRTGIWRSEEDFRKWKAWASED